MGVGGLKGVLLVADLYGCKVCPRKREDLLPIAFRAVETSGLHAFGQVGGTFPASDWGDMGGASEITLMVPLRESHCAVHTFPASHFVAIDIFTCGDERAADEAILQMIETFKPSRYVRHRIKRGRGS